MRSKSEGLIDTLLRSHQIPFRYECELVLNNRKTYYPDFTIMHPVSEELYYWEHLGIMDDKDYRERSNSKLQIFARNGIYPGKNMILTFETLDHPLSEEMVSMMIQYYFE